MVLTLALLEGGSLFAAVCAVVFLRVRPIVFDWLDVVSILLQALVLSVCCITAFYYNDLYDLRIVQTFSEFAVRLIQAFGVAFILLSALYLIFPDIQLARGPFVSSLLVVTGLLLPLRALSYVLMRSQPFMERVLILGMSPLAQKIIREIEARPDVRYAIVGVVDDAGKVSERGLRYPILGPLERVDKIAEELRPHRVIVALAERRRRLPVQQLLAIRAHAVHVEDGAEVYERLAGKLAIESLAPSALIFSGDFIKARRALRRLANFAFATAALVLAAPVMGLTAAIIKLDSRGPIFFTQARAGLDGRPFRVVKFRTMHGIPDGPTESVWYRDDSARLTRIGRWIRRCRLDELPQLWNIVRGDMDLVGPRPEMFDNVPAMTEHIPYYALRHAVRPGVTGWAQVRHGYSVTLEDVTEKMRLDLYYIKHMSIWLDLRILVDSVKIVLFGRGAR